MSQEKVDQYKKDKANRQKIMRREKWTFRIGVFVACVVMVGLLGWFSFSVYQNSKTVSAKNQKVETVTLDTTDVDTYLSSVTSSSADDTATDSTADSTATSAE